MLDYLKSQKNKTILFFTNDSNYYNLADIILLLKDGNLIKYHSVEEIFKNENKKLKQGIKIPFTLDLSNKLISYNLLEKTILNIEEMVDEIWD